MNASSPASWIDDESPVGRVLSRSQMFLDAAYAPPSGALSGMFRSHFARFFGRMLPAAASAPIPPLAAETGLLLQQIVGVTRARLVVSLGTDRGIAAVWLASALRDTLGGCSDRSLIAFEHDAEAVRRARAALRTAGISRYADIRSIDPLRALQELETPIDLLLVNDFDREASGLLRALTPRMRSGTALVVPRVHRRQRALAGYLAQVRAADGPFRSLRLPQDGGIEWSTKR